ncbi:hypothetical protein FPSE_04262 [Fusarium pseudograminearum CS3096]|uniref:Uncharacterized protein n=1 Tax=Fusarium pseudograminearum (strain CS3096) TaxID=1028729 RepID=K3VLV9_FUSPC|nr:hypothetical protein FPSE_04262 [Fusarium pseudograminearum CS3096]EKJ75619.1 hypothetical protein FPSE_04262 [Fusarium pseudograminearum CS3096]KAF0644564.1 hypothetical protein FPSE5266_04262 [Fusarium pseudograminearum]
MAFSVLPHERHLLRVLLVLASFLLAPASPAAVESHIRVFSIEEPDSPQEAPSSFMDFPSQYKKRDGSCPISGDHWCGNDLPGDFCCSSTSVCKVLAANTTTLCCPKNSRGECEIIMPITCQIERQNPLTNPQAEVKSLALNQELKRCGSKSGRKRCCPFGYSCRDDKECVLDEDQDESYAFLLPVPEYSSTSSPTATSTATSSATSDVLAIETSEAPGRVVQPPSTSAAAPEKESSVPEDEDEEDKKDGGISPTGVVTAGTVAGVCCLAGIGIFVWLKWFRKKRTDDTPEMSLTRESWGYFSDGGSPATRHLHIARGPNDKFIVTPTTAGFTPSYPPLAPIVEERSSPVELPATPVSLCMWSGFENAAVEEPKLAYVIPAKPQT